MTAAPGEHGWVPQLEGSDGPLYRIIADAIARAIDAGDLRAGDRLPTHRALADRLGIDLTTVTRGYAEARRRGLLDATVGRGTFVRSAQGAAHRPRTDGPIDLSMNLPPLPADPWLPDLLRQGFGRVLSTTQPTELLTYRPGGGTAGEIAAGVAWLRPTLGDIDPARVVVSPGAQPALATILGAIAAPGEAILVDRLTYPGITGAAAQAGVHLVGIGSDEQGMRPQAVAEACRADRRVRAVYCVPTIQNPTAATMGPDRRRAIADVARQHRLTILEDDAYGLLPSARLPALSALAPDCTWHVATVSKVLTPVLRVAWVVAPDDRSAARLADALRATVLMASPLLTGLLASWVHDGTADALLCAVRQEAAARQHLASQALPAGSFTAHPEGLHLWLSLPPGWDRRDFVADLRRQDGLAVVPGDAFLVDGDAPQAVRLSLGAAPDRDALARALRIVATTLRQDRRARFAGVV